jgi:hypothetical protein
MQHAGRSRAASEPVRGIDQHDLDGDLRDQIAQPVKRRTHQGRARHAGVLEGPLVTDVKILLLGEHAERSRLRVDRLFAPSAASRTSARRPLPSP